MNYNRSTENRPAADCVSSPPVRNRTGGTFAWSGYQPRPCSRICPGSRNPGSLRLDYEPWRGSPTWAGDGTLSCSVDAFAVQRAQGHAEPDVVVPVPRRVPIPVRRPAVPRVVVPATAAIHAVRACFGQSPNSSIVRRRYSRAPARRTNASRDSTRRAVSVSLHSPVS